MSKAKTMAVLLILGLVISLSACGKVTEKATEKGMEKLIESQTGSKVDITKDGAKIQADGQTVQVGEGMAWPKDAMGGLPEPKAKVTFVINGGEGKGCSVGIEEFENADAKKYMETLKELGYKALMTVEDKESMMFVGQKDKISVNFTYNITSKEGAVTYSPKAE